RRQEKVLRFLRGNGGSFFADLEKNNPITLYRFAKNVDEAVWHLQEGRAWTREDREAKVEDGKRYEPFARGLRPGFFTSWLMPKVREPEPVEPDANSDEGKLLLGEMQKVTSDWRKAEVNQLDPLDQDLLRKFWHEWQN